MLGTSIHKICIVPKVCIRNNTAVRDGKSINELSQGEKKIHAYHLQLDSEPWPYALQF